LSRAGELRGKRKMGKKEPKIGRKKMGEQLFSITILYEYGTTMRFSLLSTLLFSILCYNEKEKKRWV